MMNDTDLKPLPAPRAFIFDVDGTIIDNMSYHNITWQIYFARHGKQMTISQVLKATGGKTAVEVIRSVIDPNISDEEAEKGVREKEDLYYQLYGDHRVPIAGFTELLTWARAHQVKLGVATSADWLNIQFNLGGTGLLHSFDTIVGSEDITHGKPDPEIFLLTASRLGVQPADCLVFEDSLPGLEAAHRAGIPSVAITTSYTASQLTQLPGVIRVVDDYTGLRFSLEN